MKTSIKELDYKTLSFLEQQLDTELLLYKKYINYSNLFFDNELKEFCLKASLIHKNNYKRILSYFERSVM